MKIINIFGTRPQYIKVASILRELGNHDVINIDTGQHYDKVLSENFIKEFNIKVHYITKSVTAIQVILNKIKPDFTLLYGDTFSTIIGLIASLKYNPCHIEAGCRSFSNTPEEISRFVTDHLCKIRFTSTKSDLLNLNNEALDGIFVGDVMFDNFKFYKNKLKQTEKGYIYLTLHRGENVDNRKILKSIVDELNKVNRRIILPIHPRLKKRMKEFDLIFNSNIEIISPLPYIKNLSMIKYADIIITDSGGIQKEAYWLKRPCLTLRETTEWIETVNDGWNKICKCEDIIDEINNISLGKIQYQHYGNGNASKKIIGYLEYKYE